MKNSNTQYITLDLNFTEMKAVKFKQYNKGSQSIILTITENGQPLPLDSASMKCYFKMITPESVHKFNDENVFINEDGTVTVNIKESYCLTAGTARAELNIVDTAEETQICTMNFNIIIEGSVYDNHVIEDCDDFSALTKVLTENEHRKENLILLDKDLRAADDIRMENENIRIANENTRIANEETRISNENNRIGSENDRENAEQKREDDFSVAITNAGAATQNAITAADTADAATQNANTAAGRADTATQTANTAIEEMRALMANDNILHVNQLGAAGGVATLDEEGFLSASQIPDRTIEYYYGSLDKETQTFTTMDGEVLIGKINKCYVDTHTNIPYTWTGTEFIATGSNLALGTTSATAFPGDRGVSLEQRVTGIEEYHNEIPASDIRFSNSNTSLSGANVQAAIEDLTATATPLRNGLLSAEDKKRIDSYANITEIPITLSASSWTGTEAPYAQTVAVAELQNYNNCSVELHPDADSEQENALLDSGIEVVSYSETSGLTFSAASKPSVDIPILLCAGASMNVVNVPSYIGETPVTGIKGSAEASFRQGQVTLTPEHLGALPADGDSQNNTVTFPAAEAQNSWTDVADLASGEKHRALFHKLSTMMKNVKYLYGLLGTTNIASIGNGTVTGALSKLNTDLSGKISTTASCNKNWNWSGKSGQPTWLWGGEQATDMYLYNPSNFRVSYATNASSADSAGKAKHAENAALLNNYSGSTAPTANTYVLRDGSGYSHFGYINSNTSNNENPSVSQVIVTNGSDNYYRKASLSHLKAQMGLNNVNNTADSSKSVNYAASAGSASSATNASYANSAGSASSATNANYATNAGAAYGVISTSSSENSKVAMSGTNAFRPYTRTGAALDGVVNLGTVGHRWRQLYVSSSSISTSDQNSKNTIKPLTEKHLKFFMLLQPVSFKFDDGTSGRTHVGFISQDVEAAMETCGLTDLDFAGFCKDVKVTLRVEQDEEGNRIEIEEPVLDADGNPQYIYSLRYEEFIALNTLAAQKLWEKVNKLEKKISQLFPMKY